MRYLVWLFSVIAIGVAAAAVVLPLWFRYFYFGYIGCSIAGAAALYGLVELLRAASGRSTLVPSPASATALVIMTVVSIVYLRDELVPTSGYSLDMRLMTKGRLHIGGDAPSTTATPAK